MDVDMGYRLTCVWTILHCDCEGAPVGFGGGKVDGCEETLGELNGGEEVGGFLGVEIRETFVGCEGAD